MKTIHFYHIKANFSGRDYCYLKNRTEQNTSEWVLGEGDIVFITRKLGVNYIEVKGNT